MPNLLASRVGRLTAFSLLYVSEGLPQGFAIQAVTVQMRRTGLGTAEVGAFAAVILLPWAWKWAVGPVVDLFYVDRLGRRRGWIVACQVLMALTILAAWPVNMTTQFNLFVGLLILHNVFAATQDVAIDALAVTALKEDERGLAGGLMFAGAYTGTAIGGATLYLADWVGFSWAFPATAGAILAITSCVSLWLRESPTPPVARVAGDGPRPARWRTAGHEVAAYAGTAAKAMFGSRAAIAGLVFALLPAGAMALSSALAQTLQVDLGLSDNTIATLGLVGSIVAAGGCVLGGYVSDRVGRRPTLSACVVLTAVPTAVMALGMWRYGWVHPIDTTGPRPVAPPGLIWLFVGTGLAFTLFQGLIYGSRTAIFMSVCDGRVAATQFTGYMALMNVVISYSTAWIGWSAAKFGYPLTLCADAVFGILCILPLSFMRPREPAADPEDDQRRGFDVIHAGV